MDAIVRLNYIVTAIAFLIFRDGKAIAIFEINTNMICDRSILLHL
ncbi:MAG: hypothetical protein AAGF83_19115 [Cyanobacteria bacterium P01_G01_bin.67]